MIVERILEIGIAKELSSSPAVWPLGKSFTLYTSVSSSVKWGVIDYKVLLKTNYKFLLVL